MNAGYLQNAVTGSTGFCSFDSGVMGMSFDDRLQEMVDAASCIVFFGGAGVSTESGIPDFRSVDGLYSQRYAHPPETMLSHSFFMQKTEEFLIFTKTK